MSRFESVTGGAANKPASPLMWFMALLLTALVAGCGGGGGQGQILGMAAGSSAGIPAGAIPPGGVCAAAGPTIPTVTFTDPTSGNQFVTTSTGSPGSAGGKLITATFSLPMNAATITATSFTLAPVGGAVLTGTTMGYDASTHVATLTTPSALLPNTSYTAIITTSVTSATGVPVGCLVAWNFKTAGTKTGLTPIKMGLATPFGISATAGLTTAVSPSTVNADVLLDPLAQCNATAVDAFGGIGSCAPIGFPPTITGTVISSLFTGGRNIATIKADLNNAYLSLCPAGVPSASCTLNGGLVIGAPAAGIGGGVGAPCVYNINAGNCFTPGVYTAGSSITITGDLTLDAQGNPDAVFVFQAGSTVGTAAGAPGGVPGTFSRVLLVNGAKASNVWWVAGSSATAGLYSEMQGNLLAAVSVTLNQGATSCGRMLAGAWVGGGGAITLGGANVASVPGQPFAPPAGYATTCQ